ASATAAGAPAAARFRTVLLAGFLSGPAFQHSLATEADLAIRLDVGDHHRDFVAHLGYVLHLLDVAAIQLADVHQAILVGHDLHEGAEVGCAHHLAGVNAPDLRCLGQRFHALPGDGGAFLVVGGD